MPTPARPTPTQCASDRRRSLAAALIVGAVVLLAGCGSDPTQPPPSGTSTPTAADWLAANAVPLTTVDPTADLGDLAPLGAMVGDAHLVAFGEATHGTRQFFQLKHRALEYLVRQQGFTAFAIEASMPEANAVDQYVRTGQGDPAVLLSNLYFWTWNTQEVLDLIRWMRAYNAGVTPERQVRFFGFDMQFPGAAIDSAAAFVHRADPARAAAIDSAYACLTPYRNHGAQPGAASYPQVAQATPAVRLACAASVAAAYNQLAGAQAAYTAATTAAEYARALQSARLVMQWEDYAANGFPDKTRDGYMAENVGWLRAQLPAGARMMLWAHNFHVSRGAGWMGSVLGLRYGADYVNVGFALGSGTFNAFPTDASGRITGPVAPQATPPLTPGSFDAQATASGVPRFLLDTRRIVGASAAAALAGPTVVRMIGSIYFPNAAATTYDFPTQFPRDFDLMIYVQTSTASTLLPFQYQ